MRRRRGDESSCELVRELVRVDLWLVPSVALRSALHSRSGDGDESRGSSAPTGVLVKSSPVQSMSPAEKVELEEEVPALRPVWRGHGL